MTDRELLRQNPLLWKHQHLKAVIDQDAVEIARRQVDETTMTKWDVYTDRQPLRFKDIDWVVVAAAIATVAVFSLSLYGGWTLLTSIARWFR